MISTVQPSTLGNSIHAGTRQRRPRWQRGAIALGLLIAMFLLAACPANKIAFQGRLTDAAGNPLNGTFDMRFRYWDHLTSTEPDRLIFESEVQQVTVTNGLFDVPIGSNGLPSAVDGLDPAIFARQLFLEIEINGEVLKPRQELFGSPYAMSLIGGAVLVSFHEGDGNTGADDTDITDENYGTLTVAAFGSKGTALAIKTLNGGGDLIRGCTGALSLEERLCENLVFRVTNDGNVRADGAFTGGGADFAEMITVEENVAAYEPGDVLVVSATRDRAVALANEAYSTAVIGVYSTKPTMIGGFTDDNSGKVPVAIVGIVPVKVSAENGAIRRGDLLTTSSTPGHAMLATEYVPGAILGKAMGELESGTGIIEVVLLLQ